MPRGRPRKVDLESALERSMNLFWKKGFEATSMNDLSAATGVAKPGLYAAFGDKEALFCEALSRYYETLGRLLLDELVEGPGSVSTGLRRFLDQVADGLADDARPEGCFVVNSLVECANEETPLAELSRRFDAKRRQAILDRLRRARQEGELSERVDVEALADFFAAQALALGVMGRAGADRAAMARLIDVAMTVLSREPDV
jgi:AcrR family transcriptional regulator